MDRILSDSIAEGAVTAESISNTANLVVSSVNATAVNVGANVNLTTDGISVGNSTVNTSILSTGKIRASAGILFGSDTADVNVLDDYEEGTWTVTLTCGTSGTVTLNSSINEMSYIKIGSQVTLFGRVNIASVSSPSGSLAINLPFSPFISGTEESDFYAFSVFYHDINLSAGAVDLFVEISAVSGIARFFEMFDNAAWTAFPSASLKGNGNEYIYVTGSYRAA